MNITVIKTLKEVAQLVPILQSKKVIAYDLESTGLSPHYDKILLISIAVDKDTSYVIDVTYTGMEVFKILEPLLTNPDIVKLGFNWVFDHKMTFGIAKVDISNMWDCMLAEQLLTAGLFVPGVKGKQFSLEAVAYRRLNTPMNKDIRNEFIGFEGQGFRQEAYEYAAYDTMLLFPIWEQQVKEIEEKELGRVCQLEQDIIPVTSIMELTGIRVDREKLASLIGPFDRYVNTCYRALQDAFISGGAATNITFDGGTYTAVNPASKPQMTEALRVLGITPKSLNAKDVVTWDFKNSGRQVEAHYSDFVDDEEISEALEKYGGLHNPILRLYTFYTGAQKLVNVYVKKELERIDPNTQRRYGWFKSLGARSTGRYSSDMQQKPKDDKLKRLGLGQYSIRQCYVASPGAVFLNADYSSLEAVIIADMSGDKRLAYEHMNGDLHVVVANECLGLVAPIAKELNIKNKKEYPYKLIRDASKPVTYGVAYGVQGATLSETINIIMGSLGVSISKEDGDVIIDAWKNKAFPQAGRFLQTNSMNAVTLGYTKSAMGRKRFWNLDELKENKWRFLAAQREGSNQPIQSTNVDMTKSAMRYIYRKLDRKKARIILTAHDELLIESSIKYADEAAKIMKWGMEQAALDLLPNLGHTVIVDVDITECYSH